LITVAAETAAPASATAGSARWRIRRESGGAVREAGARRACTRISEQDQPRTERDADVAPPHKTHAGFCGCYDWHSSVHGHWLLVRLVRTFPDASFAGAAREALKQSLTADNLKQEAAYLRGAGRASFERPYGLAWLPAIVRRAARMG